MKKNMVLMAVVLNGFIFGMSGSAFAVAEAMQAGVAAAVQGEVKASTSTSKAAHVLKSGDKVYMGDKIETGADGQLQILLLDQTVFTLGPLSTITMDEFVYNPSNDDGMVKASMMKGIFRVVSGKVAHKKPENMSVALPSGSIGFRGTNVAGIIDGAKSTIVLLGPVGTGRIFVTNVVNGEVVAVDINEAGYATIVDGPGSVPVPVFQISEADLNRIAGALGQNMTGSETSTTGDIPTTVVPDPDATVDTQQLLGLLNNVETLNEASVFGAQNSARDTAASTSSSEHSSPSQNESV